MQELSRVTSKAIFISVPNRAGLGYKMQLKDYSAAVYPDLRLDNIDPPSIIRLLKALGWEARRIRLFRLPALAGHRHDQRGIAGQMAAPVAAAQKAGPAKAR